MFLWFSNVNDSDYFPCEEADSWFITHVTFHFVNPMDFSCLKCRHVIVNLSLIDLSFNEYISNFFHC